VFYSNKLARLAIVDDLMAVLIYSLTKSLFFSRKPITEY